MSACDGMKGCSENVHCKYDLYMWIELYVLSATDEVLRGEEIKNKILEMELRIIEAMGGLVNRWFDEHEMIIVYRPPFHSLILITFKTPGIIVPFGMVIHLFLINAFHLLSNGLHTPFIPFICCHFGISPFPSYFKFSILCCTFKIIRR